MSGRSVSKHQISDALHTEIDHPALEGILRVKTKNLVKGNNGSEFYLGDCGHCELTVDVCFDLEDGPNQKKEDSMKFPLYPIY